MSINVYEARHAGREYCCNTEGSDHYKEGGIEPLDLMIAKGLSEDFCIGNMSKYAFRFKKTRNLEDLKKVSDYAHILCGVELLKDKPGTGKPGTDTSESGIPITDEPVEKYGEMDNERLYHLICDEVTEACSSSGCPFYIPTGGENGSSCDDWAKDHPDDFRRIAIEYLEGKE